MVKVNIEVDSKFTKEEIEALIKKASQEVGLRGLVEEIKETIPSIVLLAGLLQGRPKGKVTTTIK